MGDLRYPIGKFTYDGNDSPGRREELIQEIEDTPVFLRKAVKGLSPEQIDSPYRPEGWTVRQVVHHVPDSHLNAYLRFKLALTEENPAIKPYKEARWAELPDTMACPLEVSLSLIDALHRRWVALLRRMEPREFGRTFYHPENGHQYTLDEALALYAWHGRHHVAHVTSLRERNGW